MLFLICFSDAWLHTSERRNIYFLVVLIIAACAFISGFSKPRRIALAMFNGFTLWVLILFWMYFFYGLVLVKYNLFPVPYFSVLIITVISLIILFVDIPSKSIVEIFAKVCAVASVVACVFVYVNEWSLIMTGGIRIGNSASGNVNTLALCLGIMSIPIIYNVIIEKKFIYWIPYAIVAMTMIMTGSKKALIYIFLGIIIFTVLKYGIKLQKYILPVLVILVFSYLVFNNEFFYEIIGRRTVNFLDVVGFNINDTSSSVSTSMRLEMYRLSYEAFWQHPIWGGGWYYFSEYSGLRTYSHNNFFELLVTYGMVGFFIYYSMYLWLLIKLLNLFRKDDYAKLFLAILIVVIICDTGAVTFSSGILSYSVLVLIYLYIIKIKHEEDLSV